MRTALTLAVLLCVATAAKQSALGSVNDDKEFKKLIRTRTNVLVVATKDAKALGSFSKVLEEAATATDGAAVIVTVNCGDKEGKKFCKKNDFAPEPVQIVHFHDGKYNVEYTRPRTLKSLLNFLKDPKGDPSWEEQGEAPNIDHIDESGLKKILKSKKSALVFFYAPWCGHCKTQKPLFAAAASQLKQDGVDVIMAGFNADGATHDETREKYDIKGFPTILYFENGKMKYVYGGKPTTEGFVDWVKNPSPPAPPPPPEKSWAEEEPNVLHLTDATFAAKLKEHPSMLVMFYAPWCGHCKAAKPEWAAGAAIIKEQGIEGTLAAMDCTVNQAVCGKFDVKGYPTIKYFKNGKVSSDYNGERKADALVSFLKDPSAAPPAPPAASANEKWSDVPSAVVHLTSEDFEQKLKAKKQSLVMFYAPWCGHCKSFKPKLQAAADELVDNKKVMVAALDCTDPACKDVCDANDIKGYPTLKVYKYGKFVGPYDGPREQQAVVDFLNGSPSYAGEDL